MSEVWFSGLKSVVFTRLHFPSLTWRTHPRDRAGPTLETMKWEYEIQNLESQLISCWKVTLNMFYNEKIIDILYLAGFTMIYFRKHVFWLLTVHVTFLWLGYYRFVSVLTKILMKNGNIHKSGAIEWVFGSLRATYRVMSFLFIRLSPWNSSNCLFLIDISYDETSQWHGCNKAGNSRAVPSLIPVSINPGFLREEKMFGTRGWWSRLRST